MTAEPECPDYDLPSIMKAQRFYFSSGRTRPLEARIEALSRFGTELETRTDELLKALSEDLGKPPLEAYLAEVYFLISEVRLYRKKLKRWARPKRAGNPFYFFPARSEIRREPFGTTLIASAWN